MTGRRGTQAAGAGCTGHIAQQGTRSQRLKGKPDRWSHGVQSAPAAPSAHPPSPSGRERRRGQGWAGTTGTAGVEGSSATSRWPTPTAPPQVLWGPHRDGARHRGSCSTCAWELRGDLADEQGGMRGKDPQPAVTEAGNGARAWATQAELAGKARLHWSGHRKERHIGRRRARDQSTAS